MDDAATVVSTPLAQNGNLRALVLLGAMCLFSVTLLSLDHATFAASTRSIHSQRLGVATKTASMPTVSFNQLPPVIIVQAAKVDAAAGNQMRGFMEPVHSSSTWMPLYWMAGMGMIGVILSAIGMLPRPRASHASPLMTCATAMFAASGSKSRFPVDYGDVLRFSSRAVSQMLKDKVRLMEIDFPVANLASVFGDAEGGVEMTKSAQFVAQFTRSLPLEYKAIRVFFPDQAEGLQQKGLFEGQSRVRIGYLTRPTGLSEIGWDIFKPNAQKQFADDDELFVVAYPSFNPNEMIQVKEIADADPKRRPIIIINGELDRIRSGYYPAFFYPRLQAAMKDFLPKVDQAFYIHNYKGTKGGALYRVYPEPWQVLRRVDNKMKLVHEQETMPTSREVSLDILPRYP